MKSKDEVPEVIVKNEITLVDSSPVDIKRDSFIVKNPNWATKQTHRVVFGGILGLLVVSAAAAGSSIGIIITPQRLVISGAAIAGLVGTWLVGRFSEEIGVTAYILRKLGLVSAKRN